MFEAILQEIQKSSTIILHRHSRPDGDALGSQIGLKHILRENFPEKAVYTVGDEAGFFSFMLLSPIPSTDKASTRIVPGHKMIRSSAKSSP